MALRWGNWKIHFAVQQSVGAGAWTTPLVYLKAPTIVNLRADPFEEAEIASFNYLNWGVEHLFMLVPAIAPCHRVYEDYGGVSAQTKSG